MYLYILYICGPILHITTMTLWQHAGFGRPVAEFTGRQKAACCHKATVVIRKLLPFCLFSTLCVMNRFLLIQSSPNYILGNNINKHLSVFKNDKIASKNNYWALAYFIYIYIYSNYFYL